MGWKYSKVMRQLGKLSRNTEVQILDLILKETVLEFLPPLSELNSTIMFTSYAEFAYFLLFSL